jgi:hypothetical protein
MRSEILNLNFDYVVHIYQPDDVEFQKYLDKLSEYTNKRYKENYNRTNIDEWLMAGRFNLGAVQLYVGDSLVRSLFIEEYKGWVMISRMISWEFANLPLLTTCALPKIYSYAKEHNYRGVFASVNEGNKIYFNCLTDNKKMSSNAPIFQKHRDIISTISMLSESVIFNYVPQYIAFKGCTDECKIEEII